MMKTAENTNRHTVRLFVAIQPGRETLSSMEGALGALKQASWAGKIRWTPVENIHLTLKFIGDAREEHLNCLTDRLARTASESPCFSIGLNPVMWIPSRSKARVIAAGVSPSADLERLADEVDAAVSGCGFPKDRRRFKAHVTLGRCRELDARRWSIPADFSGIALKVCSMDLMQSILSQHGAVYRCLRSFALAP